MKKVVIKLSKEYKLMKAKLILGGILLLLFSSCSNDNVLPSSVPNEDSKSSKTEFAALFKSDDKESLKKITLDTDLQKAARLLINGTWGGMKISKK
ncbi:hypothetical protein ABVC71_02530 [Prevotella amnii]|uniref:hypothetical protein n=1 Tax=Prevotella amnii TaxID=419005 RepID=UPI00336A310C